MVAVVVVVVVVGCKRGPWCVMNWYWGTVFLLRGFWWALLFEYDGIVLWWFMIFKLAHNFAVLVVSSGFSTSCAVVHSGQYCLSRRVLCLLCFLQTLWRLPSLQIYFQPILFVVSKHLLSPEVWWPTTLMPLSCDRAVKQFLARAQCQSIWR